MLYKNLVQYEHEKRASEPEHEIFGDDALLTECFHETDAELRLFSRASVGGSCSCSCILTPKVLEKDGEKKHVVDITVLNVGDSWACYCAGESIENLSVNHDLKNAVEVERVKKAGGDIQRGKINKCVNMTRTFGNFQLKRDRKKKHSEQILIASPEIKRIQIDLTKKSEEVRFVIVACDGITETVPMNEIAKLCGDLIKAQLEGRYLEKKFEILSALVKKNMHNFNLKESNLLKSLRSEFLSIVDYTNKGINLGLICNDIVNYSILKGSLDNNSVIIVLFDRPDSKKDTAAASIQQLEENLKQSIGVIEEMVQKSEKHFHEDDDLEKESPKKESSASAQPQPKMESKETGKGKGCYIQ